MVIFHFMRWHWISGTKSQLGFSFLNVTVQISFTSLLQPVSEANSLNLNQENYFSDSCGRCANPMFQVGDILKWWKFMCTFLVITIHWLWKTSCIERNINLNQASYDSWMVLPLHWQLYMQGKLQNLGYWAQNRKRAPATVDWQYEPPVNSMNHWCLLYPSTTQNLQYIVTKAFWKHMHGISAVWS